MIPLPVRDRFHLPDGVVYLDGNSLGPLPAGVADRIDRTVEHEWCEQLIRGWNDAGWMELPTRVGDRIGALVGAPPGSVVVGDTLSIKIHQLVAAAVRLRPERSVILSDTGNFPTDLYMADGLLRALDRGHELRLVEPGEVAEAIDDSVAAVMLTHVDYRTGRMHDMTAITARAHAAGAIMIWDLAHSAGAVPVDLAGSGCEFAAGCTYKFLNGGPGAPAFVYVRPDLIETVDPILSGWLGHADPFAFELGYRPAPSIERLRVGTPPVIQTAALDRALDVWDDVTLVEVRAASIELSERFIAGVEASCPDLELASPRDPAERGSQVSFRFPAAYEVMQALIERNVIGDHRAPDILRFGITPLYLGETEIDAAVEVLAKVLRDRSWDDPRHRTRNRVT